MANVEVRDNVLWIKHIHGAGDLRSALEALPADATVQLKVDGEMGVWRKMKMNAHTNTPTPGLQPIGPAQKRWRELFRARHDNGGELVEIELADIGLALKLKASEKQSTSSPTSIERAAAWEAIKDLWRTGGWRSDAPYGPRDELYDR